MLIANGIGDRLKTVRLIGVKKTPEARKREFGIHAAVHVDAEVRGTSLDEKSPRLRYIVSVKLYIRRKGDPIYVEVKMDSELNHAFLKDAGVDLGQNINSTSTSYDYELETPFTYLCSAIAAIIAARGELVVSAKEDGFLIELVWRLPQELRTRSRHGRMLPRMCGSASFEKLQHFFRPKKKTKRKKAAIRPA